MVVQYCVNESKNPTENISPCYAIDVRVVTIMVTTSLENLEMLSTMTAAWEMSGILIKVREVS